MFSKKLRLMRKKSGLTQAKLAKRLNISPSTVGMYEQGRREPDSAMLVKIADVFDVSVDYLVGSKKSKLMINSAKELAEIIEQIVREKSGLSENGSKINRKILDAIVEAVREGIHEAFDE